MFRALCVHEDGPYQNTVYRLENELSVAADNFIS